MTARERINFIGLPVLFTIVSIIIMLIYSANKTVELTNVTLGESTVTESSAATDLAKENKLLFSPASDNSNFLKIPLPDSIKTENILIENHYMDHELWIGEVGGTESFYTQNIITGNYSQVQNGYVDTKGDTVYLKFKLNGFYEYKTILENNYLYIQLLGPRELYQKIMVIDASCGGDNNGVVANGLKEKDLNLAICQKLKAKLDTTDIKVYYTRMDDSNPGLAKRVNLANKTRADMMLCLGFSEDEDSSVYGLNCFYNDSYFIPGFGNIELADVIEKTVATNAKEKANGLFPIEDDNIVLKNSSVPTADIRLGYLTNPQEAALLERDEYQETLAESLYQAILSAYEQLEQ